MLVYIKSISILMLFFSGLALAAADSNPTLFSAEIEQLEWRDVGADDTVYFDGQLSLGNDHHNVLIKTEIEREAGVTEDAEVQVLYGTPISTYWDIQLGVRKDLRPDLGRKWGVIAIEGLAPYFIDVTSALFIGESGRLQFRVEADHEIVLSQKWTLTPSLEINIATQNDESMEIGSGLAKLETGLRLRYRMYRKFSPYIGVNFTRKYGNTADYARDAGNDASETVFLLGISTWF